MGLKYGLILYSSNVCGCLALIFSFCKNHVTTLRHNMIHLLNAKLLLLTCSLPLERLSLGKNGRNISEIDGAGTNEDYHYLVRLKIKLTRQGNSSM